MASREFAVVSSPEFVRGWNAAISHSEDYLVGLAYQAGNTEGVPKDYKSMSSFAQRVLIGASEMIGRVRKPTARTFG